MFNAVFLRNLFESHVNDLPSILMSSKAESTPISENMMSTNYRSEQP